MTALPLTLTPLDLLALALLCLSWLGVTRVIEHPPRRRASVSVLMKTYRRDWMRQFVHRDPRIFDGNILASLREGTSFFASACMIAIGGGLAALAFGILVVMAVLFFPDLHRLTRSALLSGGISVIAMFVPIAWMGPLMRR